MSLKYEIALINVWWEEQGTDTRYFEGVEEQTNYFETKANGLYSTFSNFNIGDNIKTRITYKCPVTIDINTLVARNYAVVRRTNEDNTFTYRYYFAYCRQDCGNQVIVDLSLDDIQTNLIKYKNNIGDCFIKRAHLDRFDEIDSDNKVRFNLNKNSKLFNREISEPLPKRLSSRTKITYKVDSTPNSKLDKWLNDNISGWNYVFLDSNKSYNFYTIEWGEPTSFKLPTLSYSKGINGVASVIVVPIVKSNNLYVYNNITNPTTSLNTPGFRHALNFFRKDNNDTSFYYSNKISLKSPLPYKQYVEGVDYIINNNNLFLLGNFVETDSQILANNVNVAKTEELYALNRAGVFLMIGDDNQLKSEQITLPYDFEFNVEEIITSSRDMKYNPKLLSNDFIDLNLSDNSSSSFTYDVEKINNKNITIKYDEMLTPDITKGYARIEFNNNNNIYINETERNMTGLVSSNDTSLPYDNGQLALMLANNKNFYMQTNMQIGIESASTLLSLLSSASGGGMQTAGGLTTSINNIGSLGSKIANTYYSIDNMRNAPSQLKNSSGNAVLQVDIDDVANYMEIYESLDYDKQKADDTMFFNGYSVGVYDTPSKYLNIRKFFNFLQCDIDIIFAPISLDEKSRLKQVLSNGVRFWNSDIINYTKENYERRLER